jgi:DHA1 family tetracycline resistance protein-like MFS transporter
MSEPGSSRRALTFIFITVLIDMIGFGIIIPVMPELIMELTGEGLSRAARYGGWLLFLYALMQFFFAPIIGNLSDRFGRRPVLIFSLVAFGFDYLLMGLAPTIAWLFAGRFVAGIAGATHSTANAYIADVSPPERRAQNFGLMGAAFGLGFILGPVLGGLLGEYGPRVPFFAASGLALCNAVYGFLILPETLPAEERRRFDLRRANPVGALAQMRRYPVIVGLFGAFVLYMIAHDANPATWTYYTMLKFDWTEREVGYSMGFVGLGVALVQGFLIRAAIPRMGELRAVYLGFALMSLSFVGFAFASAGWMMYAFIVPFSLGGLATPALRGIMSNRVPANAQGELQGALASVMSLTAIVAPLFMTQLFGYFTSDAAPLYFPGAPFLTAGVLLLGSIAVFAGVMSSAGLSSRGSK